MIDGPLSMLEMATNLQNHTHWRVEAEPSIAARMETPGIIAGPLRRVAEDIAQIYGAEFTLNPRLKTITFLEPDK